MEYSYYSNGPKVDIPNSTAVLVLGILSIVGCCCWGIVGIICGTAAMLMAKTATDLFYANPERYTEKSFSNAKTGKMCALIGLILSGLSLVSSIAMWISYGFAALSDPQSIIDRFNL